MSKNRSVIDQMVDSLRKSGELDKLAEENSVDTDNTDNTDNSGIDYEKLAAAVANILQNGNQTAGLDKVATLVNELNEEAEKLAASQEMIITSLYNGLFSDRPVSSNDIIKMASEEDSLVPHIIDNLYKYAAHSDALLSERYGDDYDENDVVKLAFTVIQSTEDPFGFEAFNAEAERLEKEANQSDEDVTDQIADEIVAKIKSKLSN